MRARRTVIILAALMISACADSELALPPQTSASTSLPTPTTEASVAPPTIVVRDTIVTTVTSDDGANPFGGDDPEDDLMPSVVCMNLQDAQNEIQDHGVFFSGSEDATGQGRNQIIDSNWQVVGQDPEAGTPIGEFDATLFVVKYGEQPNPC